MSPEELAELNENVASLTLEEARGELLECARYGELECVEALLNHFSDGADDDGAKIRFIDTVDGSSSTALHKAACNGHLEVVELLVLRGSSS